MAPNCCGSIERAFYDHLYGDYETLQRWAWLYVHAAIAIATALAGYAVAEGAYGVAALLVPFPLYYGYRRYLDARPADGATP